LSLQIKSAGDAISPRWMERGLPSLSGPIDLPDKTASEGLFDQPYGFADQRIEHVFAHTGVPVGFWRSVGHSHNAFFTESFIDELAVQAGRDPVEFRRALLKAAPRHRAVLDLAVERAGWGTRPLAAGRARGVALHESFGSVVAQVAEVSLEKGQPRIHLLRHDLRHGGESADRGAADGGRGGVRVDRSIARAHRHPRRGGAAAELSGLPDAPTGLCAAGGDVHRPFLAAAG